MFDKENLNKMFEIPGVKVMKREVNKLAFLLRDVWHSNIRFRKLEISAFVHIKSLAWKILAKAVNELLPLLF